jgi:hypothetical protein
MNTASEEYLKEAVIHVYPDINVSQTLDLVRNVLELRKHVATAYLSTDEYDKEHFNLRIAIDFYNDNLKKLLGLP